MELKRCAKGHFYDPEQTPECPQCALESRSGRVAAGGGFAPGAAVMDYNVTEPLDPASFTFGNQLDAHSKVEDYDVTQPLNAAGVSGFYPVVGWLVCLEGASRGMDYRIRSGYNYIGRAPHMDICIEGDATIRRERHAVIGYDPANKSFRLAPVEGNNPVRLNGEMLMGAEPIKVYDELTIGSTRLVFVPLCGEGFDWNDGSAGSHS